MKITDLPGQWRNMADDAETSARRMTCRSMLRAKVSAEGKSSALRAAASKVEQACTAEEQQCVLAYLRSKNDEYTRIASFLKSPSMEADRSGYVGRAAGMQIAADQLEQAISDIKQAKSIRAPKRRKQADEQREEEQQTITGEDPQQGSDGEPAEVEQAT